MSAEHSSDPSHTHLAKWGRLTWLRDGLARLVSGPVAPPPAAPAVACTIVKLDRIGDFVLSLGAIHQLVRHFGAGRRALVVPPEVAALASQEFPGVARHIMPAFTPGLFRGIAPRRREWRRGLSALACTHLVCLRHQRSLYRDFVLRAIPAGHCWWVEGSPFGDRPALALPPSTARYPEVSADGSARALAAHRQLVGKVIGRTLSPVGILPRLSFPSPSTGDGIIVAPLAHDPIRDPPPGTVWAALERCTPLAGASVLLIGGAHQAKRLQKLRDSAPPAWRDRCGIAAGETTARWIELIAGARLVFAADSASAHLATALDRPLVVPLGGGHSGMFAPWHRSKRQVWLRHPLPCYGCDWRCPYPSPRCLADISPARFATAMLALLTEASA